jgi:hypothetical protein
MPLSPAPLQVVEEGGEEEDQEGDEEEGDVENDLNKKSKWVAPAACRAACLDRLPPSLAPCGDPVLPVLSAARHAQEGGSLTARLPPRPWRAARRMDTLARTVSRLPEHLDVSDSMPKWVRQTMR